MSGNLSPGFTPQGDSRRSLGMGRARTSLLLEAANGEDRRAREAVRDLIQSRPEELTGDFFEEAARSVRFYSVADTLLSAVNRMSYVARKSLAEKFQRVGRDGAVSRCLADSPVRDAEGLWMLCEASLRGRFVDINEVDLKSNLFAASLEDSRAEARWFQLYVRSGLTRSQFDRGIQRLIDVADREQNPHSYHVIGEIFMTDGRRLVSPDTAREYFCKAAYLGHSPSKLVLLQHFSHQHQWDTHRSLVEFYNDSYFPGLSWCYEILRSEERPLRHIDAILRSYLWHPDMPVSSQDQVATAVDMAERLSTLDASDVRQWALRNSLLVMDAPRPS
jgi:TPR repeat protein